MEDYGLYVADVACHNSIDLRSKDEQTVMEDLLRCKMDDGEMAQAGGKNHPPMGCINLGSTIETAANPAQPRS